MDTDFEPRTSQTLRKSVTLSTTTSGPKFLADVQS